MANPWTKKNPFLSMWLSGANARGRESAKCRQSRSWPSADGMPSRPRVFGPVPGSPPSSPSAGVKPSQTTSQQPRVAVREANAIGAEQDVTNNLRVGQEGTTGAHGLRLSALPACARGAGLSRGWQGG